MVLDPAEEIVLGGREWSYDQAVNMMRPPERVGKPMFRQVIIELTGEPEDIEFVRKKFGLK